MRIRMRRGFKGEDETGYITVREVIHHILAVKRCFSCKKWYVEDERYQTYPPFERPGCPRCAKTGQLVRAGRRRTYWLKHVGQQQEPVKFPASITKILYAS